MYEYVYREWLCGPDLMGSDPNEQMMLSFTSSIIIIFTAHSLLFQDILVKYQTLASFIWIIQTFSKSSFLSFNPAANFSNIFKPRTHFVFFVCQVFPFIH